MGISQIVATVSAFVAGLAPMSCHHKSPPHAAPTTPPAAVASALTNPLVHDLGEITLTNHCERYMELGDGKECILFPKLLDKHNAELTITYEAKTPAGQIHDMIVSQVETKSGDAIEVTLGDFQLSLKPDITDNASE